MTRGHNSQQLAMPIPPDVLCAEGHLFRPRRNEPPNGCQVCGTELVDWSRTQRRAAGDWQYTFSLLKQESIRREYWTGDIDPQALGSCPVTSERLEELAMRRLKQSVSKVYGSGADARPYRDGYQTPKAGNILFYAQHALACCCRRCMRYWHGIPYGRPLAEDELNYFVTLVVHYVDVRLAALSRPT